MVSARNTISHSFTFVCYLLIVLFWGSSSCYGFGTFGFDVHHRFSDPVKGILGFDELPEKGSLAYYAAMAHRDNLIKRRHLQTNVDQTAPLIFNYGNETYRIPAFGYLHYANVSVGTPSSSYLVALDTGSDVFWLPCDCTNACVRSVEFSNNDVLNFNIYSPNTSSTSQKTPCNSTMCNPQRCATEAPECPYQVQYLSNGTSSTGILVEDVLHLTTDDAKQEKVEARITFGCGKVQTGTFLEGAAPNGLFGLGMEDISVPSILARDKLASNSFSMCFGPDGLGRIRFGDNGSLDQGQTPFNLRQLHPNQTNFKYPRLNLTMKGGDQYYVINPLELMTVEGVRVFCLAVVKSGDVNIIGQNFMTGYRVTFDREKKVLGWKESNCYDNEETNTLPINPSESPAVSPSINVNPEATAGSSNNSHIPAPSSPANSHSLKFNSFTFVLILVVLTLFAIV
ncbi:aspartyl protease family protein 1 isoform X2 [Ziziphus jujuba]|uniref:Aspartyl protease family protein 1 isoform X2 n=1 Tax=Ziziphus jujuba TaxID=326968 RepID=A0ABM3IT33_ZIZJJ|nr:aspartyl protease family protein 1 isoform X2 [Ziziphus jujuba]